MLSWTWQKDMVIGSIVALVVVSRMGLSLPSLELRVPPPGAISSNRLTSSEWLRAAGVKGGLDRRQGVWGGN